QRAYMRRHVRQGRGLGGHHVRVEIRRPADRLAGVVDDEVQARAGGHEISAEGLDARRVPEIETEDFETVRPLTEIGLFGVARGGIAREPRRDDEMRAGAEELQPRLIADLDAAACEQRDASTQVGQFRARGEVLVAAGGAELVVEGVKLCIVLLADVAMPLAGSRARLLLVNRRLRLEVLRRECVWRGDERTPTQRADSGFVEHGVLPGADLGAVLAGLRFRAPPPRAVVGVHEARDRPMQSFAEVGGELVEQPPVAGQVLEELGRCAHLLGKRRRGLIRGVRRHCRSHVKKRSIERYNQEIPPRQQTEGAVVTEPEEDFAAMFEASAKPKRFRRGQTIEGTLVAIGREVALVDVGGKGEAQIEIAELKDADGVLEVSVGERIQATVVSTEGGLTLSRKLQRGAATNRQLEEAFRSGLPVEGRVEREVKGGYEVRIGGARGFCPFSQFDIVRTT